MALDFGFDVGSSEHLRGARVATVDPAGPAHTAGLQKGDIIAAVSGRNAMGLDHTQVRRMIQRVIEDDAGMLVLSVAAPLGGATDHTDGEEGVEMGAFHGEASRDAQDRPKPPSYVVIRNKLRNEFGDATWVLSLDLSLCLHLCRLTTSQSFCSSHNIFSSILTFALCFFAFYF